MQISYWNSDFKGFAVTTCSSHILIFFVLIYSSDFFKAIIGSQETSEENEPKVTLPNHKYIINNGTSNTTPSATYNFTMDNILQYFFGKVNCSQAENEKNSTEDKVQIINKDCDGNSGLCK